MEVKGGKGGNREKNVAKIEGARRTRKLKRQKGKIGGEHRGTGLCSDQLLGGEERGKG